jgi:hypothetical protein
MRISSNLGAMPALPTFWTRTAKSSAGTASAWLFFYSTSGRQPRVSVEINMWLADNSQQTTTAKTANSAIRLAGCV